MNILQLCCHSNLWSPVHNVTSYDLRLGNNIFDIAPRHNHNFDLICAAPPCDQYTKANSLRWVLSPDHFNNITAHCIKICLTTKKYWFLENPPGRITHFFPELLKYRIINWRSQLTNKEYTIYGNFLCIQPHIKRYPGHKSISNKSKIQRELWQQDFIDFISLNINF
jgi:hypothetical protein